VISRSANVEITLQELCAELTVKCGFFSEFLSVDGNGLVGPDEGRDLLDLRLGVGAVVPLGLRKGKKCIQA